MANSYTVYQQDKPFGGLRMKVGTYTTTTAGTQNIYSGLSSVYMVMVTSTTGATGSYCSTTAYPINASYFTITTTGVSGNWAAIGLE
jgi:hypothetical protein